MSYNFREEYPRPQFQREEWMTLNGTWDFSFDKEDYDRKINVPFVYESRLSGIEEKEFHENICYRRFFSIPDSWKNKQIILHFGAVDYECKVLVNQHLAEKHVGGQTGFSVNITELLLEGQNELKVLVKDFHKDLDIPRGKQFWKEKSESIFYTPSTGIWQSVWLEPVSDIYIKQVFITPLFDEKAVKFEYELNHCGECTLEAVIAYNDSLVSKMLLYPQNKNGNFTLNIDEAVLGCWNITEDLAWTPENPRLFDVTFRLKEKEREVDQVKSYFGMRKISIENGKFLLNNRPYFQKLILDQGYWPDGILTAPSDESFVEDIKMVKEMGFNGVRKHQKVEDPRFLYHADRLGLLVWGEIGAGYAYSRRLATSMMQEWQDAVLRDYNHPCIVVWAPLNESWGVLEIMQNEKEQNFCKAMYAMTKALDTTRPVSDNDGWEHVEGDLLTIHDYEARRGVLTKRYTTEEKILQEQPAGRPLYVSGKAVRNKPIIISEFGGISYHKDGNDGWGYSNAVDEEDFLQRLSDVISPLLTSEIVQGFCYTQLTDVEQEINGLLTYQRKPKVGFEKIRNIIFGDRN
ncbi:glycoside hydrolase family 2 protein [Alloiococcus sp. CFN-8]|uniref:glycoside hydrolase family 2 protein n=1 Tax=Alloiococcus sp. CFN-8 TaxID=3416081 RepID=UPI003CF73AB7